MAHIQDYLAAHPGLETGFWVLVLLVAALVVFGVVRRVVLYIARRLAAGARYATERDILEAGIISRLAAVVPGIVVAVLIGYVPGVSHAVARSVEHAATAFIVFALAWAAAAACRLLGRIWQRRLGTRRTVTGFVQIAQIVIYVVAVVLIIAILVNRSPMILISSLGALTAVLVLVFKDTLLSLVASVEIASTDFVRVGDWIEMPSMNANGTVEDFSLYTVKVRNFDNTYANFPTQAVVSQPYKNWRGMTESGGRRIKRSIPLDQRTVRFLSEEDLARFAKLPGVADYLAQHHGGGGGVDGMAPDGKRAGDRDADERLPLTNATLFRAHVLHALTANPMIRKDMTLMVRHLEPGPFGLPLQVYCFTATTNWVAYEGIQADIFDQLLAILPQFELAVFQSIEVGAPGAPSAPGVPA